MFNLSKVVDEYLETTDKTDYKDMALDVASSIATTDLRSVVELLLPGYIASRAKLNNLYNPLIGLYGSGVIKQPVVETEERVKQKFIPSRKISERREWSKSLRVLMRVAPHTNKPLGECTIADLDFVINDRAMREAYYKASRERIEALRDSMKSFGVTIVGDLPDNAIPTEAELELIGA